MFINTNQKDFFVKGSFFMNMDSAKSMFQEKSQ